MSKYGLNKTWQGYEIVKFGDNHGSLEELSGDQYLVSVRNGKCKWCQDYTYSAHYSLETASKHLASLRREEIK